MYAYASTSKDEASVHFQRQGSIRKVITDDIKYENSCDKKNDEIAKVYKIYRLEYVILAEYKMVQTENIQGVYVIPSKESPLMWFGVIFVRNGLYEDGVFRFNILLNENFPDSGHPKVVFRSEIFHLVIDPQNNELNLMKAFPKWNKTDQHVWQVVKYIQWTFYNVEASIKHAVNTEAVRLFKNDLEAFKAKALESVTLSKEHLYDAPPTDDKHYITFEQYVPEIHDKVRAKMINSQEQRPSKVGYSWVLPGSNKPLTRPHTPSSESES